MGNANFVESACLSFWTLNAVIAAILSAHKASSEKLSNSFFRFVMLSLHPVLLVSSACQGLRFCFSQVDIVDLILELIFDA